jgi:hypothetical protein
MKGASITSISEVADIADGREVQIKKGKWNIMA